jgi:hypothetical protein
MKAAIRDELTVRGRHPRGDDRHGEIIEVRGDDGGPPYMVRWLDGYEGLFSPLANTTVQHHSARAERSELVADSAQQVMS